jgi:uncharacterized protein YbjQ (UPF0145 family)
MEHRMHFSSRSLTVAAVVLMAVAQPVMARDEVMRMVFQDVLNSPAAKEKLDGSVKFYLAGSKSPNIVKKLNSDVSNHKTNGFNKSADESCQWVALSALLSFQEHAKRLGMNAVVDIESYYKKVPYTSATDYECHVGALMTGVAFKGTYAQVAQ